MDEPRLKAKLRVQAMLRQAQVAGHMGMVLRPGDADAGAILLVLRQRSGLTVLSQARTAEGALGWMRGTSATAVDQATADAYVARQVTYDGDLWVLEIETAGDEPPFPLAMA